MQQDASLEYAEFLAKKIHKQNVAMQRSFGANPLPDPLVLGKGKEKVKQLRGKPLADVLSRRQTHNPFGTGPITVQKPGTAPVTSAEMARAAPRGQLLRDSLKFAREHKGLTTAGVAGIAVASSYVKNHIYDFIKAGASNLAGNTASLAKYAAKFTGAYETAEKLYKIWYGEGTETQAGKPPVEGKITPMEEVKEMPIEQKTVKTLELTGELAKTLFPDRRVSELLINTADRLRQGGFSALYPTIFQSILPTLAREVIGGTYEPGKLFDYEPTIENLMEQRSVFLSGAKEGMKNRFKDLVQNPGAYYKDNDEVYMSPGKILQDDAFAHSNLNERGSTTVRSSFPKRSKGTISKAKTRETRERTPKAKVGRERR